MYVFGIKLCKETSMKYNNQLLRKLCTGAELKGV